MPNQQAPASLALRSAYGFFAVYLTIMTAAMLSPRAFNLVMGMVGLSWPGTTPRELHLLVNMNLCGLIPTAFMAARTAILGEWTRINRAFFLCMLGANLVINVWSIAIEPAMASVLAGDFVVVVVLLGLAVRVRPAPVSA